MLSGGLLKSVRTYLFWPNVPCREEMTQETFDAILEEARRFEHCEEVFVNEPGPVDDAAKLLSDMVAMGVDII